MSFEINLCYFIIYIIEAFILLQYTSTLFNAKYNKLIELPFLLFLYGINYAISFLDSYFLNAATFFLINFLFIFMMYYANIQLVLFHAAISTTAMSASELIIFNMISHYTADFYAATGYALNVILLAVFSKFIYFLILYLLSHLFRNDKENCNSYNKSTLLLSLIPLTTLFVLMTITSVSTQTPFLLSIDWMLCISSFLMLGLNIFIFSLHYYIQKENKERTELELLLQKENDSIEYYKMLLQQTENQKILIHDIKKHLQSIAILNENKDFDRIAAYIDHLIHSSSLQNNHNLCEHKILNSILGQYKKLCSDKHIDFLADVRHSTVDFMLSNDLTALFCNLLDNAVEASEKTADPFIELNVSQKVNIPYTIITMTNTCRQDPFDKVTSRLPTQKENQHRHGYGLRSIQRIVKNYQGSIKMYYEKETTTFHTIITLKAKKENFTTY